MTQPTTIAQLSNRELLAETKRVVDANRRTTAELLSLLTEIDHRKLYRDEGYSSLFKYCTHVLHFSEPAAYNRITAARAARHFPIILVRLAAGDVNLTTITLLAAHLTEDNHERLLDAARHLTKPEVERLVAAIDPQPDVRSSVRRLPDRAVEAAAAPSLLTSEPQPAGPSGSIPAPRPIAPPRPVITPLAPERYLIKFTVDRGLTVLIEELERTKLGSARRPRATTAMATSARHIPAAVKREVWARDEGRCAFAGTQGRCPETGFLEFHHVKPFADGGATTADNLQLRCRSHNALEAERHFGKDVMSRAAVRPKSPTRRTLSGQSSPRLWT